MSTYLLAVEVTGEMSLGELIVGIGTLALAGVTWWLARRTGQEVDVSRENLALIRESIEALDRPFLVASPDYVDYVPTFAKGSEEPTGADLALLSDLENWGRDRESWTPWRCTPWTAGSWSPPRGMSN